MQNFQVCKFPLYVIAVSIVFLLVDFFHKESFSFIVIFYEYIKTLSSQGHTKNIRIPLQPKGNRGSTNSLSLHDVSRVE